ncbi:hypothetical protein BU23DRAFT_388922, partial [Bimuria novae-zelandiae CBS 107.79]
GAHIYAFRTAARIPHPNVFATPETIANAVSAEHARALYLFNGAHRAHHNFVENYAVVLSAMLVSGPAYPRLAAAAGAAWVFGRVLYSLGYT